MLCITLCTQWNTLIYTIYVRINCPHALYGNLLYAVTFLPVFLGRTARFVSFTEHSSELTIVPASFDVDFICVMFTFLTRRRIDIIIGVLVKRDGCGALHCLYLFLPQVFKYLYC
jgi:hypothetical protein